MLIEENLAPTALDAPLTFENAHVYLARKTRIKSAADVSEEARVKDVFVKTEVVQGKVALVYKLTECGERRVEQVFWENRFRREGGGGG